jgi:hypothetical protein
MKAAALAKGKAILTIGIRPGKKRPLRRWVIHRYKMGFFRDCRNSKTAGHGPPLILHKIPLIY